MKSQIVPEPNFIDLGRLLVNVSGKDNDEVVQVGRKHYEETFITGVRKGIHKTHDDEDVYFWQQRFNHAFFITNRSTRLKEEIVDKTRVARVKWIKPLISGNVPESECWLVRNDSRPENRLYIILPHNFVVWLEPRDAGGWKFSTLYTTNRNEIRRYQRNGTMIWKHR